MKSRKGQNSTGREDHERPQEQDEGVRHIGTHHLRPLAGWSAVVILTSTEIVAVRPESGGKITNGGNCSGQSNEWGESLSLCYFEKKRE